MNSLWEEGSLMQRYAWKFGVAVLLLLGLATPLIADDSDGLDVGRPNISKLGEKNKTVRIQEFYFPFLLCQTGTVIEKSVTALRSSLVEMLRKAEVPFKSHYSKSGKPSSKITPESFPLPSISITGSQLSGLADCNKEFCIMKLQNEKEKTVLSQAKERLPTYHSLVLNRVKNFLDKNELMGYEGRLNNRDSIGQMLKKMPYLEVAYPKCTKFLRSDFWDKASTASCNVVDSFIREEMVTIKDSILQPILRISEVFELVENGNHLFFEMHIYTNHYFDSSARVYEILPLKNSPNKSAAVITDLMEIDELVKSSVVRFLYLGKMQNAVTGYQVSELESLR